MELEKLKKKVIGLMQTKLDPRLAYHNLDHTLDVYDAAMRLAELERVNGYQLELIQAAALLHDIGMVSSYVGHEEESIKLAEDMLREFNFGTREIEQINRMIMATRLPQSADSIGEKILCDADLDYLGRPDFNMISLRLKYEWDTLGINPTTLREWYQIQVKFLSTHSYYTESATKLRQAEKQKHLDEIMEICHLQKYPDEGN